MKNIIATVLALCLTVFLVSCLSQWHGTEAEPVESDRSTDTREEESSSESQTTAPSTENEADSGSLAPDKGESETVTSRFPNEADPDGTKRY